MKKYWNYIFIILFLTTIFLGAEIVKSPRSNELAIYFFNVGQGDAEMIQKGDFQILIDGGPDDKVLSEMGKVMPLSDRKIDVMILSHPHADHLVGLNQILDRYEVGAVYSTGVSYTSNQYLEFLEKIKNKKIEYKLPKEGDSLELPAIGKINFLWPGERFKQQIAENINNTSEIVQFCAQLHCALFSGDAEVEEQKELLDYYSQKNKIEALKSEVLKIPHHGSSNGAGEDFFKAIDPKYAVISAGANNQFGHPHAVTLALLDKLEIPYLRTDKEGTVRFGLGSEGFVKAH